MDRDLIGFRQRTLRMLPIEVPVGVHRRMLEVTERPEDFVRNHLTVTLRAQVLADHVADDVYTDAATVEYPRSTWQMFKHTHRDSWWLGWLVRRRPVEMDAQTRILRVEVERYLTYPESVIQVPEMGPPRITELVTTRVERSG